MAGGKRLRPILVIATYELFKQDYEKCMAYAMAIEMVHNFSLIHDDLPGIDNDDFRHGKLTNHKKFNEATAILAGDGLLNQAYIVISDEISKTVNDENRNCTVLKNKVRAFNEFSKAVDRMIAGEYIDTELEGKEISTELLEYIHVNKTGALLKLCVRMGAILADASEEDIEKLSRYADRIGLAFQIKDDILSEEGDAKITGKPVGNDKELGKCTYVSQYGLDGAKNKLEKITQEAIDDLEQDGEKAEFLKQLAIAIIMDGNRRWAKERGLPVGLGHKEGAKTLEKIVRYANKRGIKYITVYAFSTENWKRAEEEVKTLMTLFQSYLDDYSKRADSENIKVKIIGSRDGLSEKMKDSISKCMERTKDNTGITFNIALNYGGRDELLKAVKNISEQVKENKLNIEDITEETISNNLYTQGQPDPDLLIRTSGEIRLSNFLPWQLVYSEFLFIEKYWPDFSEEDLENAIKIYQQRNRKFGAK